MPARYTVQEFLLTHGSWLSMLQRCVYDGARKDKPLYRGRGITVCLRWRSFENFIEDLGPRPGKEFSIDRYPNQNGNYEPGNVRWATAQEQANNTRNARLLTFNGETKTISAWARATGIGRATLQFRLGAGWSLDRVLGTPAGASNAAHTSFARGRLKGKKLTAARVECLLADARTGKHTAVALGKKYDVTGSAVCQILRQFDVHLKKGRPRCSTQ